MLHTSLKNIFMLGLFASILLSEAYADEPQTKEPQTKTNQVSIKLAGKDAESDSSTEDKSKFKITRINRKAIRMQRRKARQGKKKFRKLMSRFRQQMIPPRMLLKRQSQLELSDSQVKQIKDLMKAAKQRVESQQNKQKTLVQDFETKLDQWEKEESESNETQLLSAMQAYLSSEKARRNERLKTSLKVRKLLSIEQRQKLIALKKEFWSKKDQEKDQAQGQGKAQSKKAARRAKRRQRRLERLERRMERLENQKNTRD